MTTAIRPRPVHHRTNHAEAARVIVEAALTLARDPAVITDRGFCREVARRLSVAMIGRSARRAELLAASPRVIERSGRVKTLLEMIEDEPGDERERLRLARLLLRAIEWA